MGKKKNAPKQAHLLQEKITTKGKFDAHDARRIDDFLSNLEQHACIRPALQRVGLALDYRSRQLEITPIERGILIKLRSRWTELDLL